MIYIKKYNIPDKRIPTKENLHSLPHSQIKFEITEIPTIARSKKIASKIFDLPYSNIQKQSLVVLFISSLMLVAGKTFFLRAPCTLRKTGFSRIPAGHDHNHYSDSPSCYRPLTD